MAAGSVSEQSSLSPGGWSVLDGPIAAETLNDIQKFVEAATTMTVQSDYRLGDSQGWQSLWEVSLAAMEHRRESLAMVEQRLEARSPKKKPKLHKTPRKPAQPRELGSVSAGPEIRKGRRHIALKQENGRVKSSEDVRSPGALQFPRKEHDEHDEPQRSPRKSGRRSPEKTARSDSTPQQPHPQPPPPPAQPPAQRGKATLLNAIRNLPRDKQQELLQAVAEMEQELIASRSPLSLRTPKLEDYCDSPTKLPSISRPPAAVIYGDYDETYYILEKLAVAMQVKGSRKTPSWQWHRELVRPGMMRDRLEATLDVSLTGREVALLMRRFDEQGKGVVDICEILYRAAQIADEHRERRRKRKLTGKKAKKQQNQANGSQHGKLPRLVLASGSQPAAAAVAGGPAPYMRDNEASIWSASGEKEAVTVALEKLAELAYRSIIHKARLPLDTAKYVSETEFRHTLHQQGGSFTARELAVLIRRYKHHSSGRVDQQAFLSEFISLGKDEIRKRRQKQAQHMFLEALSRGNSEEALSRR